jgi:AcrR family transcriptional regulator
MGIAERKEKQKTELRKMILEASMKLFVEEGFEKVSIRKIADLIEYSPTTVYLYFRDKNEILFHLHQEGFLKMAEYNTNLADIRNPLMRLHKMGENYLRFGAENPEYYDLMFIQPAPMEALHSMQCVTQEWKEGDRALDLLKQILKECMDHNLIRKGDINVVAMAIWSMVHGLVSLQNKQRFDKLVPKDQVMRTMEQSLHWLLNTIDTSYSEQ